MRRREGIALVAALSLITLLGLLVIGSVAATAMQQRAAHLALAGDALASGADAAATSVLRDRDPGWFASLSLGVAQTWAVAPPPSRGIALTRSTASVIRLGNGILWITGESSLTGDDRGIRRVGLLARFPFVAPTPAAGIVARGSVSIAPDVVASVDSSGDAECRITAAPPFVQAADSVALVQAAWQVALLDTVASIRHVRGDTTLAEGAFEGIMLVDGNVTIDGAFSFTGLLVVRGRIVSPKGLTLTGAMISQAPLAGAAVALTGSVIRFAPCLVAQRLRGLFPPRIVPGRAWAELF